MQDITIIHLSDLHISSKSAKFWSEERAKQIARSSINERTGKIILLIISGDTANSGAKEEYSIATNFINTIVSELEYCGDRQVKVIVAPGNHDCDFSVKSDLRNFVISQRSESTFSNHELIDKLREPLKNYYEFENKTDTFYFSDKDSTGKSGSCIINGKKVQIRVFCSPLFSQLKEKKGDLFLPLKAFEEGWENDGLRIAVMHHPTAWFDQNVYRRIRTALRANSTFTLYGHEHEPEMTGISLYNKSTSTGSIEIDGAVLHNHDGSDDSSFITLDLDKDFNKISATVHNWNISKHYFERNTISGYDFDGSKIDLASKILRYSVSPNFEDQLADAGIVATTKSGRPIKLDDIYIVPHLLGRLPGGKSEEIIIASELLTPENWFGGVIIQGEEKAGKSSLLYWLFKAHHNSGLVPIYLPLRTKKLKNIDDFKKLIRSSFAIQYPEESIDAFWSLPKERRVFLLDDVDDLRAEILRTAVVDYLKTVSHYFFASTTLEIKIAEVLTEDSDGAMGSVRQLSIDRFTSSKRSQMIHKWVDLVEDRDSEEEFLSRVDQLEKGATAALGHNMVPRVPQMVLIFLQSSSTSTANKLESGALAHYYMYLVTQHLLAASVPQEELDECFSFSRAISFKMHQQGRNYITLGEMQTCNDEFSELYYPGVLSKRLNILRNAKLLIDFGSDAYQWKHSYFHYLFLGEYLGKNIQEPSIQFIVKEMAMHLYVRSNANALLFLVHFTKEPFVFECLTEVIEGLFSKHKAFELGKDTQSFSSIVKNAREIYLPSDGPNEARTERQKSLDDRERHQGDGLQETAKNDELSDLDELIVLFKTSEIIGQVLKEQYASIKRPLRESVIIALLDAYLRACNGIISRLQNNNELVKKWIDAKAEENDKTLTAADRAFEAEEFVAQLVQMFMYAFFQKLGDTVAAEKTLDLIKNAPWKKKTESSVFLLSCELNLQKRIPIAKIDELLELADKDDAFVALIRNLVQMRVAMFHTRAPDLQALSTRFKIPIDHLNRISFREPKKR